MANLFSSTTSAIVAWPEPLIIDVVAHHLGAVPLDPRSRCTLARRHAAALGDMIADRGGDWRDARVRLEASYAALGVSRRIVATIDHAVFIELSRLAAERHRTSPRRRCAAASVLREALVRLTGDARPAAALAA